MRNQANSFHPLTRIGMCLVSIWRRTLQPRTSNFVGPTKPVSRHEHVQSTVGKAIVVGPGCKSEKGFEVAKSGKRENLPALHALRPTIARATVEIKFLRAGV